MSEIPIKKTLLSIAPILLMLIACEQVVELGTVPFEEKLVVRAVLQADTAVEVCFTRTFSLNETYSTDQGVIANVDAFIVSEGISYPLTYAGQLVRGNLRTGFARYTASSLIARGGKSYELFASWNGHQLYSKTFVPDSTVIDTAFAILDSTQGYYYGSRLYKSKTSIRSRDQVIYFIEYRTPDPYYYTLFRNPVRSDSTGKQLIFDGTFYLQPKWEDSLNVVVYSLDGAFYDYYRTRSNIYGSSLSFFSGFSGSVLWNVEGEAIGMFIGMNATKKKAYVP